ncbi:MAG: hypothetical protein OXG07_09420 [Anaerolineaceae bacterium]|nr:hypothetical protein [Anaerolineaceae bacterium]
MMDILKRPVLYNVITIVALILSVIALLDQGRTLIAETSEVITRLEGVAAESDPAVGEAAAAISASQQVRGDLYRQALIAMIIAILANVIANYLGRSRQWTNLSRIEALEAEIEGLRGNQQA